MKLHTDTHSMPADAKEVFKGNTFSVWQWEQKLFDGTTATYEAISRPDYAAVIGVLPDRKILLIQDQQPHRPEVLTPAGGKVEAGETAEEAARRELKEETGYSVGRLKLWFSYQPSARLFMTCHFYIAQDIILDGKPALEGGERVELRTYTFDAFVALGENPQLRDWFLRIKLLEAQLDPAKKEALRKVVYE